jgi:hypothetical protein
MGISSWHIDVVFFWSMSAYGLSTAYQYFIGTYCLYLQGRSAFFRKFGTNLPYCTVSKPIRPEYEGHRKKYRLLIKLTFGSL